MHCVTLRLKPHGHHHECYDLWSAQSVQEYTGLKAHVCELTAELPTEQPEVLRQDCPYSEL